MKPQSNGCRTGQETVQWTGVEGHSQNWKKNVLSAFLWELDYKLLLFSIFKLSNDGIAGIRTKYTNCTKQGGIASCVGQYPFYLVVYTVVGCF